MLPDGPIVTASIGVVEVDPSGMSPRRLIESADAALYAAKDGGGDCVILGRQRTLREPASMR
jgi:PleD family two-component response regulator